MFFLKKAFKKVYKPLKKFAKSKLGKTVLIAGATMFTAGLGTVGFGAFKGATTLSSVFGAAGKTIAAGAQGLLGAIGLGSGVSPGLASGISGASGGETLFGMGGLFGGGGTSAGAGTGIGGGIGMGQSVSGTANAVNQATNSSILGNMNGMFGGMGKYMLAQGIMGGVQAYFQGEERERQQRRMDRRNIYGGAARGSGNPNAPASSLMSYSGPGIAPPPPPQFANRSADPLIQAPTQELEIDPNQIDPLGNRPNPIRSRGV